MQDRKSEAIIKSSVLLNINLVSSLIVGMSTGVGFHPVDRALYLQLTDKIESKKHLFSSKYWKNPMMGLSATFVQRTLSASIYFALQGELNTHGYPLMKDQWQWGEKLSKFTIGMIAGGFTGVFSNASYAVKFYTIDKDKGSFSGNFIEMWKAGGSKPFAKGIYAGVMRCVVFGSVYEVINAGLDESFINKIKQEIPVEKKKTKEALTWTSRFFSAGIATIISSPFNYARNMQFKSRVNENQPSIIGLWCKAWQESNEAIQSRTKETESNKSRRLEFSRLKFFQHKFCVGAGSIRTAAGMAIQQIMVDEIKNILS